MMIGWVDNYTRGSILIAMLMHAASNVSIGWLATLLWSSIEQAR